MYTYIYAYCTIILLSCMHVNIRMLVGFIVFSLDLLLVESTGHVYYRVVGSFCTLQFCFCTLQFLLMYTIIFA